MGWGRCLGSAVGQHPYCCKHLGDVAVTFGMVGAYTITPQDTNMSKRLSLRKNPRISVLLYLWSVQQYHHALRMTNNNRGCPYGDLQLRDREKSA